MKNLLYFILVLLLPEMAMTQNLAIGNGAYFTVKSGTSIVVPGDVGDSGTVGNSGTVDVAGNWTNNGAANVGASGTVVFDGSSAESVSGSTATTFGNLTINNSSGVDLSSVNATVSATLAFTSGLITTGGNTLYLLSGGNVTGAGASAYVYGNFNKTVSGATSVNFEIGDASIYAPIDLTFGSSATGSVTASTTPGEEPNINSSKVKSTEDVARYWTLSNSTLSGFGQLNPTYNYATSDLTGLAFPVGFISEEYTGGAWTRLGISGIPTSTVTSATGATVVNGNYVVGDSSGLAIFTQPKNDTVCAGATASFTSSSYSTPNPTIQWQENQGSGWNNVVQGGIYSNPHDTTLVLTGVTSAMNGYQYQAVFTGAGSASSNAATLKVNPLPTPTIAPGGPTSFCQGGSVNLDAGAGYVTYVWNPSGSIETITASTSGSYKVTVTDVNGCTGTTSQTVTVYTNPTTAPGATPPAVCSGSSTTLAANATPGSGAVNSYSWSSDLGDVASGSVSPSSQTTYTVTISDVNSCSATGSVTINVNTGPTAAPSATPGAICVGQTSVLAANATQGGGAITTYAWSSGLAGNVSGGNVTPTSNTTYTVTVTDANSCTATGSASVIVTPFTPPTITPNGPTSFCTGGSVTLDAGNGYSSYSWSTSASTQTITVNTSATYTVTVSNGTCTGTASQVVNVSNGLSPTITGTPSNFTACGSVSLNAGSGYSTYSWSPSGSSQIISATSSGTYTVSVTEGGGCSGTATVNVTINTSPSVSPNATPSAINSGQSSTIAANASPGSGSITTYAWSGNAGLGNAPGGNVSPTFTSTYNVTVTDANLCSASGSVVVTVTGVSVPTPTITGNPSNFTNCGSVSLSSSGGYDTYFWSNGGTTQTITATYSGIYTLTVTQGGASATASQMVTVYSNPTVQPSAFPNTICAGQSTVLEANATQGSGPIIIYEWSSGLGNIPGGVVYPSASTNYNLTVVDAHNCSATGSTTITVNPAPSPVITGSPSNFTSCGSVGLDAGSGYAWYLWSTGATTETITANETELYTVTVSNGSCTGTSAPQPVYVYASPSVSPSATPGTICSGHSVVLEANASQGSAPITSYFWTSGLGNIPGGVVSPTSTTTYNLTATDANGCTATGGTTVTVNASPSPAIAGTPGSFVGCGSVGLDAGSGYSSYFWSNGATTETINATSTAIYTVSVTSGGCSGSSSELVTVYANPIVNPTTTPGNVCSGQTSTLNANAIQGSAPIDIYSWSTGLGNVPLGNVSPTSSTTYDITVYDGNNCSASGSASISVTASPSPVITGTPSNFTSCGSVGLTAQSGFTFYLWNTGATTQSITASSSGIYNVTASNGTCIGSSSQQVTVNTAPTLFPSATPNTINSGGSSTLAANATPGSGPIANYNWSSGLGDVPGGSVSPTSTTTYDLTVSDINGCSATGSTTVNVNAQSAPTPTITGSPANFMGCGSVTLNAGSGYNAYSWSTGATTQTITVNSSNTYSVTVTNGSGSGSASQAVTVNAGPTASPNASPGAICSGQSTTLNATATQGTGAITTYTWSSGLGNVASGSVSPSSTTTYNLTVTDANSCSVTGSAVVTVSSSLQPTITGTPSNFTGCGSVGLNAGNGYSSYSWSTGGSTQTISVNASNTYSVTVSNGACSGSASVAVNVTNSLSPVITGTPSNFNGCGPVSLNAGSGYSSYSWSPNGSTQTISATSSGTYSVTVSNGGGCTGSASVNVTVNPVPSVSPGSNSPVTSGNSINLSSNASGGSGSYSNFAWSGPDSYSVSGSSNSDINPSIANATSLNQGNYFVTVTDNNGCTASGSTVVTVTGGGGGGSGFVWTGTDGTSFSDPNNWSGGQAPSSCGDNITIPNTSNHPTISSNVQVGNVTVNSGVNITNNATLSVCGNWTGGGSNVTVGGSGVVILNGNSAQSLSGQTQYQELVTNNTGGMSLSAGASISIMSSLDLESGNFDASSGTLTFLSTSTTQCAIIDNFSDTYGSYQGTLSGTIHAERYYAASSTFDQHYMGSPVNTPLLSQFGAGGSSGFVIPGAGCSETSTAPNSPYGNVFALIQSNGSACGMAQWYVEPGSASAVNGQGYSVNKGQGSGILSLTGTANLNNSYQLTGLSNSDWSNTSQQGHTFGSGWQLVSNPYLATLQISNVDAGIESQIQIWNTDGPYAGSYQPEIVGLDALLPPFQGFMVKEDNPNGGTLTFNAGDRTRTPENFFAQYDNKLDILAENVSTGLLDKTTVAFSTNATDGFDNQFDADKFPGDVGRHSVYSLNDNKWMAINVRNSVITTATVPVGFEPASADNASTYTFNFNGVNTFDPTTYIYLEDKQTGTMYDVRSGSYNFTSDGADNWNRFVLHFTPPAVVSSVNASCSNMGTISVTQPGTANWNYQLKDNNNAIIATGVLNQSNALSVSAQAGTYTLTLVDNNNYTVTKSIVISGAQDVTASFTVPATTVAAQTEVSFSSTSQNANNYSWNFGDGITETGVANPTHTYTTAGTYAVTLTVTNAAGCSAAVSQNLTVGAVATGLNNVGAGEINMWSNADRIYVDFTQAGKVDAQIRIFDILGQEISNDRFTSNTIYQKIIDQTDAAYVIVSVKNDDKIVSKKLFIANVQY